MRKLYMILAAGLASLNIYAGNPASEALPFMQIDYTPRSIAMGNSNLGCSSAVALADFKFKGGIGYDNYMPELSGTRYMIGGIAAKRNSFGFSASFQRGTGDKISGENYSPSEILLNLGAGVAMTENFGIGVNVKYAHEQLLSDYSNKAVAFDLTASWRYKTSMISGGITCIGESVKSSTKEAYPLPTALDLAGNHTFVFTEDHSVQLAAKADYYLSGAFAAGAGVEYSYAGMVFARAGYHYGGESLVPSFASAGLGLHLGEFFVDASYVFASDVLNNSFAISVGVCF